MFDNRTIMPLRSNKPHIVYRKGYWRVSPMVKPRTSAVLESWKQAHRFISSINDTSHTAR